LRHCQLNWALLAFVICGTLPAHSAGQDGAAPDRLASLLKDLRAGDVEVRRGAAARVRGADGNVQRKALPVLIDLLMKEKDGQVRLAVLDTVTALGRDAESAVPALVHTLRTNYGGQGLEESHQDYRSALALAAIGKPAVEGLRGLLKERKENVRAEVIMALGRIGPDSNAAVADLILLLGDKSERIRREACLTLGRIGIAAIEPLIAAASSPDVNIRARAIESLGRLSAPNEQARRAVLKSSHDLDPKVRAEALRSLGHFQGAEEALLPILKESLRDKDENVRRGVVNLLDEHRTLLPSMATELEALLINEDGGVSRHAAFLLGKMGQDAAPRLINALARKESHIDQIAEALAQIGRPVMGLLKQAIEAPEPRVRRGAALALGQIRPLAQGTVQKLVVGLNDPDPEVKAASLTAIGYLGPRASEAVPAVRALLQDRSAEIRLQVIEILAHSAPRDERLLDDLTALLHDEDARVQGQTIDLLRSLGPPGRKALTLVIGRLNSTNLDVRRAAVEFLESHGQAAAEAVPALSVLLADPVPKIRMTAARTLGKLGKAAQPAFAELASLLGDEQVDVREVAAFTLGSLELDADVIRPHLARALKDEKIEVRRAAMKSIQRLGPQGVIFVPDIILLAAKKENQRSVDRLLRPFERSGPDVRSLPELVKQLEHEQVSVRLLAIKFLGLAGQSARGAIPALERICEDPSAEIREQAKAACVQINAAGRSGKP
jgi:HEAT repeat protein